MMTDWEDRKTGLTWGDEPEAGLNTTELKQERILSATNNITYANSGGETTIKLTDIVGERIITVKAEVTIKGTTYSSTQDVSFGDGPLSVFKAPVGTSYPFLYWREAYDTCNGNGKYSSDGVNPSAWTGSTGYVGDIDSGKMPTHEEYQAVSAFDTTWNYANPNSNAQGAALAAGWEATYYWAGEAYGASEAVIVFPGDGVSGSSVDLDYRYPVACRR